MRLAQTCIRRMSSRAHPAKRSPSDDKASARRPPADHSDQAPDDRLRAFTSRGAGRATHRHNRHWSVSPQRQSLPHSRSDQPSDDESRAVFSTGATKATRRVPRHKLLSEQNESFTRGRSPLERRTEAWIRSRTRSPSRTTLDRSSSH